MTAAAALVGGTHRFMSGVHLASLAMSDPMP